MLRVRDFRSETEAFKGAERLVGGKGDPNLSRVAS